MENLPLAHKMVSQNCNYNSVIVEQQNRRLGREPHSRPLHHTAFAQGVSSSRIARSSHYLWFSKLSSTSGVISTDLLRTPSPRGSLVPPIIQQHHLLVLAFSHFYHLKFLFFSASSYISHLVPVLIWDVL